MVKPKDFTQIRDEGTEPCVLNCRVLVTVCMKNKRLWMTELLLFLHGTDGMLVFRNVTNWPIQSVVRFPQRRRTLRCAMFRTTRLTTWACWSTFIYLWQGECLKKIPCICVRGYWKCHLSAAPTNTSQRWPPSYKTGKQPGTILICEHSI